MEIPSDVIDHVRAEFPSEDVSGILHRLATVSDSPRLLRCIVFAAHGDVRSFVSLCELAEVDFRDLIMAAEYTRGDERRYDFDRPIPDARIPDPE